MQVIKLLNDAALIIRNDFWTRRDCSISIGDNTHLYTKMHRDAKGGSNVIGNPLNGSLLCPTKIDLPSTDRFEFDSKVHDANHQFLQAGRMQQSTFAKVLCHV